MIIICKICSKEHEKTTAHYNRSVKIGANLYCSKACSSEARRLNKSEEQLKLEKSEYDKKRLSGEKREEILQHKREYHHKNRGIINPKQRIYNRSRIKQHIEYCRQPSQRAKERIRNRKKAGTTALKYCLSCKSEKQKIEFESYLVFPDKRNYICKDCEREQIDGLGITTREVLQSIRSNLVKTSSNLKVKDICKYPYFIESTKFLLLLKRLTK